MIAALFVAKRGVYFDLPGVDPWDESRDARTYAGPWPVVAHPPCSRWCQLAKLNERRYGHKVGDDAGCFAAALASVRRFGGVLEHPADSLAWPAFGLPRPSQNGWTRGLFDGAWSCEVAQNAYGHQAQKLTWLYYIGDNAPPLLDWSRPEPQAYVSYAANHGNKAMKRLTKKQAKATPIAFRDLLLSIARGTR